MKKVVDVCDDCDDSEAVCTCTLCNKDFCDDCIDDHLENEHMTDILDDAKDKYTERISEDD